MHKRPKEATPLMQWDTQPSRHQQVTHPRTTVPAPGHHNNHATLLTASSYGGQATPSPCPQTPSRTSSTASRNESGAHIGAKQAQPWSLPAPTSQDPGTLLST